MNHSVGLSCVLVFASVLSTAPAQMGTGHIEWDDPFNPSSITTLDVYMEDASPNCDGAIISLYLNGDLVELNPKHSPDYMVRLNATDWSYHFDFLALVGRELVPGDQLFIICDGWENHGAQQWRIEEHYRTIVF